MSDASRVVLFGATGMVGSEALEICLQSDEVESVVTIGRRKTGLDHPKLVEIEHSNFLDYSSIEQYLRDSDICLYCLGVYQAEVSKEEFWEITVDYLDALVETLGRNKPDIRFCLFSAQGASTSGRSFMRFANAKGRAENILLGSNLAEKFVFRPGYIRPGQSHLNSTLSARIFEPIYRVLPVIGVDANVLAKAIVDVGIRGHDKVVLENRDLKMFGTE
jgi:uncharacterized protein YbjT (DUF2867 family)